MNSRNRATLRSIPSSSTEPLRRRLSRAARVACVVWICAFFFLAPFSYAVPVSPHRVLKDPAVVYGILPNGFQYVLLKNATPSERVRVHMNIYAGSVHETEDEQGLAHFLEHMLFNGTENFSPGELVAYFQSIGMDFGADVNASTSFFHTVYDLNLPKGDLPHLEDALLVLVDYAKGALLLDAEIDRERGVILAEKQERDSVSFRTFKKSFAFELPGSILPRRMPIGKREKIEATDRNRLKQFYDRWYRPDNMVLVMVGDMDVPVAEKLIQERFASFHPRLPEPVPDPVDIRWDPHQGTKSFHHYESEAGSTRITIERIEHTDFFYESEEYLKAEATRQLADTMLQNRLSRLIREGTVSFSSASAYSGTFLQHLAVSAVTAECSPENWETGLIELEKILRQALASGFTQQELDQVQADFVSQLDAGVRQAQTRQTPVLARSLLNSLQNRKLFLSPSQKKELLTPHVAALSLEQVNQAFQESWKPDHRLILVTGNAQIGADASISAEDTITNTFEASTRQPADLFEPMATAYFPYLPVPDTPAGIRHRQENVEGLDITTIDLDNQVRLTLKQTDFKQGSFLFKVVFGQGRACEPKDKPGISHIGEQTVRFSGLSALNPDQLAAALAGRDVSIEFSVEDSFFSLTGAAEPREMELVFQLIHAFLSDPGFRPESLALAKHQYRQMYDAMKQTTDGIMQIEGERFLAAGHPGFGMAHPDAVDLLTLTDIRSWLDPCFNQGGFDVSVVGDFDPDAAISHARVYLGAFKAPEEKSLCIDVPDPVQFPKGERLDLILDTKIDKGLARLAFLTDDYWDIDQTRSLSILSRVLSERLRKTIREKLGAAYSPYAYNHPSLIHDGYGVMHLVAPVTHENTDMVVQALNEIVRDAVFSGISPEEVPLALNPVLSQLNVLRQTNAYWLNSVMADSRRYPQRLAWANSMVSGYGAITHEDLTMLARKYLDTTTAAFIRILPAD